MRIAIIRVLGYLSSALYHVYQLLFPARAKTWLADKAPFEADIFAPAGFFEPAPEHMPPNNATRGANDDLSWNVRPGWFGWLNALVLLAIRRNVRILGTVMMVEKRPAVADWYHDTFYLLPDDQKILNRFALRCSLGHFDNKGLAVLKCWVPINTWMPAEGARIVAEGTLCVDLANRWIGLAAGSQRWRLI